MYCIEIPRSSGGQFVLPALSEGLILRLPSWMVKYKSTYHILGFRCVKLDD